jgi:DNA-binding XRE family transcriptional regulator
MSRRSKTHPDTELDPVVRFLRSTRLSLNWSQGMMASHLGVTRSMLVDWELGWVRMNLETARRVLATLGAELVLVQTTSFVGREVGFVIHPDHP